MYYEPSAAFSALLGRPGLPKSALAEPSGQPEVLGRCVDRYRGAPRGQRSCGRVRGPRHPTRRETVLVIVDEFYVEASVEESILSVVVVVGSYVRDGDHLRPVWSPRPGGDCLRHGGDVLATGRALGFVSCIGGPSVGLPLRILWWCRGFRLHRVHPAQGVGHAAILREADQPRGQRPSAEEEQKNGHRGQDQRTTTSLAAHRPGRLLRPRRPARRFYLYVVEHRVGREISVSWLFGEGLHDHRLHRRRDPPVQLARRRGLFVHVLPGQALDVARERRSSRQTVV